MNEILKKYHIDIEVEDYVFDDIKENIAEAIDDNDNESVNDYQNNLTFLKSIENGVDIATLKEYYDLLDRISEACDEYHIYNDGRYISVGEG